MSDVSGFAEDAQEVAPSTGGLMDKVLAKVKEFAKIEADITRLTEELAGLQDTRRTLSSKDLPELMDQAGTDRFGIPDQDSDVVVRPWYKANIGADWEAERQEKAFDYLESLGAGDMVRTRILVELPRDFLPEGRALKMLIEEWLAGQRDIRKARMPETDADFQVAVALTRGVPWNTLTSWLRVEVEAVETAVAEAVDEDAAIRIQEERALDLELLGAEVGRICKIEKRKTSATKKSRRK